MEAPQSAATGFSGLLARWRALNRSLRIALIAIVVLVAALIAVIITNMTATEYEILYAGLDPEAAAEIYALLQDAEVPFKLEGTTRVTILIPKGQREELLLRLRNDGYPATDADLYTYSNDVGLGSTDYDRRIYYQKQLEQRIAYSLKSLDKISNAYVMVSLGESGKYSLSQNNTQAQCSVTLELKSGAQLSQSEVDAVRELVVAAVPQLSAENVSISDTSLNNYRNTGSDGVDGYSSDQLELRNQAQQLILESVYNILTPVFGVGNVAAAASVELDFDRRSTQSVTYEPPGSEDNMGIIVSLRQTATQVQGDAGVGGVVGFDPNGAAPMYPENWSNDSTSPYYQYTQELNAEVNEVREQVESQQGKFKTIDVAVTIDAGDEWDAQIETLTELIAKAVGVDTSHIAVMRTPFKVNSDMEEWLNSIPDPEEPSPATNYLMYAIIGGVALLAAFIIIMIIRDNRKKRKALEEQMKRVSEEARLLDARQKAEEQQMELQNALMEDDPAKVRLNEIQHLADEKPEVVANLLRNWLSDEYSGR